MGFAGVGWHVMQGWGVSCRVGHVGVGWSGFCRGGVACHAGMGWVM